MELPSSGVVAAASEAGRSTKSSLLRLLSLLRNILVAVADELAIAAALPGHVLAVCVAVEGADVVGAPIGAIAAPPTWSPWPEALPPPARQLQETCLQTAP